MSALLALAKSLGIDPGPLNQQALQEQTCVAAMEQMQGLQRQLEKETVRKESAFEQTRMLEEKNRELRQRVFAWFNQYECWIFQDDGHDYPESLVCPVVMSAEKLREFMSIRNERNELTAQVERLREQITPAVRLMRATGECSGWHEKAEHIEKILSEPSPAALSALKAEAGRDGFIRGYFYSRQYGFQFEEELEAAADKYFNYITRRAQEAGVTPQITTDHFPDAGKMIDGTNGERCGCRIYDDEKFGTLIYKCKQHDTSITVSAQEAGDE